MYSLTYKMMVQILQQFEYTGEVHADIPSGSVPNGRRVVLIVLDGQVTTCFILNQAGQKLYHDAEGLTFITRLGMLEWKLVSTLLPGTTGANAASPKQSTPFYPRHTSAATQEASTAQIPMHTWPTLQRSVYLLADGTRTLEQIASLLSRSPQIIGQVIHNLQLIGYIEKT